MKANLYTFRIMSRIHLSVKAVSRISVENKHKNCLDTARREVEIPFNLVDAINESTYVMRYNLLCMYITL
jgi:hypothetical protein